MPRHTNTYRLAKQRIDLANAIEGGLKVRSAAIANSASPEVEVERRNIMGVVVPSVSGTNLKQAFGERSIGFTGSSPYIDEAADSFGNLSEACPAVPRVQLAAHASYVTNCSAGCNRGAAEGTM